MSGKTYPSKFMQRILISIKMTSPLSWHGCLSLTRLRNAGCCRPLRVFVLLLLVCVSSFGQTVDVDVAALQKPINIAGIWKFHPGDDLEWAHPQFDDSSWQGLQVPEDWVTAGYQ